MPTVIKPRRTTTAGLVPTTSNLADGEMCVNVPDKKVYLRTGSVINEVANVMATRLPVGTQSGVVYLPLSTTNSLAIGLRAGGTFNVQATT